MPTRLLDLQMFSNTRKHYQVLDEDQLKIHATYWNRLWPVKWQTAVFDDEGDLVSSNDHSVNVASQIKFDGYMAVARYQCKNKCYIATEGDTLKIGDSTVAIPFCYSETAIKLENGVGRPSAYAPTASMLSNVAAWVVFSVLNQQNLSEIVNNDRRILSRHRGC